MAMSKSEQFKRKCIHDLFAGTCAICFPRKKAKPAKAKRSALPLRGTIRNPYQGGLPS
jgi:hypothetical protein